MLPEQQQLISTSDYHISLLFHKWH